MFRHEYSCCLIFQGGLVFIGKPPKLIKQLETTSFILVPKSSDVRTFKRSSKVAIQTFKLYLRKQYFGHLRFYFLGPKLQQKVSSLKSVWTSEPKFQTSKLIFKNDFGSSNQTTNSRGLKYSFIDFLRINMTNSLIKIIKS